MSCSTSKSGTNAPYPLQDKAKASTLAALVRAYKHNEEKVHDFWSKKLFIPEAVFGDRCKYPDAQITSDILTEEQWRDFLKRVKKDHHQRRIPNDRLREFAEHLAIHWKRDSFEDFEDLYEYVSDILVQSKDNPDGKIKNPCALVLYDTALRLSYRFGEKWPKKFVYLNGGGPIEAAKILELNPYIKRRKILFANVTKVYPEIKKLDATETEHFLCIRTEEIQTIVNNQKH